MSRSDGHIVTAPPSKAVGSGKPEYDIHLCSECNQQVERNGHNQRWTCPAHGDGITIRVGVVTSCLLVLGDPLPKDGGT